MSEIVLGEIDRQLRGTLKATLHTDPAYVAFRHIERDGREGGRLLVKLEEIETLSSLLTKAKAVASGAKPARHSTIRATQEELELDKRLF